MLNVLHRAPIRRLTRAACLGLIVLLTLLSYRPATALLAVAGLAQNPSEGGWLGHGQIGAKENKPRPSRKIQRDSAPRKLVVSKARLSDGKSPVDLAAMLPRPGITMDGGTLGAKTVVEQTKPDYLRLFLPASPGSPHSPPA